MRHLMFVPLAAVAAVWLFSASPAEAKCYQDAVGGGQTCEQRLQDASGNPNGPTAPIYTAPATGATITLGAGQNAIGNVGGFALFASGNFTRPNDTTAYASGDLVANSTTAGSVTPVSITTARTTNGTGTIRRVRLSKSGTSITNASFRVHFYGALPTPANGDNSAWSTDKPANYLGAVDVTMDKAFTDGSLGVGVPNAGTEITFQAATGTQITYVLVEARAAYTPAAQEVFTVAVEGTQN